MVTQSSLAQTEALEVLCVCFALNVRSDSYSGKHVRGLQSEERRRSRVFLGTSLENGEDRDGNLWQHVEKLQTRVWGAELEEQKLLAKLERSRKRASPQGQLEA